MKHRWAMERRPRWPYWDHLEYSRTYFERQALFHCIKCGAVKKELRFLGSVFLIVPAAIFFAPLGCQWRKVKKMPECTGLPTWYEAPIGA